MKSPQLKMRIRFGRTDCATSPYCKSVGLPVARRNLGRVTRDGTMNEQQVLALIEVLDSTAILREYARNNTKWYEDFESAFQSLLENGYPKNHLADARNVAAAADDEFLPNSAIGFQGAFLLVIAGVLNVLHAIILY